MTKTFCDECGVVVDDKRRVARFESGNEEIVIESNSCKITLLMEDGDFCDECILAEAIEALHREQAKK